MSKKMKPPQSTVSMINRLVKMRIQIDDDVNETELLKEIKTKYMQIFNSPETSKYTFMDDDEKFAYVNGVVENEYTPKKSGKADNIESIPIGMTEPRLNKKKTDVWSNLTIAEINGKSKAIRVIRVFGEKNCENLKNIQWGMKYNLKIRPNKDETAFFLDESTNFNLPEQVDGGIRKLVRELGFRETTISEAVNNLTKIDSDTGYPERTDLRIIKGNVRYSNRGTKDKNRWGRFTIFDGANPQSDYQYTESGVEITTDFEIYAPYDMVVYDTNSICEFVGVIRIAPAQDATEDYPARLERPTMDAILVIPIVPVIKSDK